MSTDDELLIALAGKLIAFGELDDDLAYELASTQVSVAQAHARRVAVEELRAAADDGYELTGGSVPCLWLLQRAAALASADNEDGGAQ